ncbi:hypothetical protein ALP21_200069 [Pseudomonas savastanoi pv. phaseolicola]|uniref:Uncharacterized protein n=1 Tax=Pseudomonas savastanoi pv. phaseolicola TaxID=319 RepID=A0A7Z6UV69_PSESH|nr:hypothetical protein ALP21_200069 [Pseudomonas savastanoi pv. phaseolicola]
MTQRGSATYDATSGGACFEVATMISATISSVKMIDSASKPNRFIKKAVAPYTARASTHPVSAATRRVTRK